MTERHLVTVTSFGVGKLAYGKRSHGTKFPPAVSRAHVPIWTSQPFYWHQMSNWSDQRKRTFWTYKSMISTLLLVWLHWNNWRWVTKYRCYCQQRVIKMVYLFGALSYHPSLSIALCELSYEHYMECIQWVLYKLTEHFLPSDGAAKGGKQQEKSINSTTLL